jgi:3-hexulose-6-phosphate synthase/6-phospho-3-hexuloisomerase
MMAIFEKPVLQVALDVLEVDRAIQIAREAIEGGADWLEAGTPLIKSEGMDAIRRLREAFPDRKIVADMKTIDTGALEVEMAAKSGASIVAILGASCDAALSDALRAARKYGVELMVDLISLRNPVERAREVEQMGMDYISVHVGIDMQMVGVDPIEVLQQISKEVSIPIAVAGGLNAESAAAAVKMGAEIVIVGGNIIRSAKVIESARRIREAIDVAAAGELKREYKRKSMEEEIIELLWQVSTPNISDAMHRKGVMRDIKPVVGGVKMVGRAVTVQTFEGDWAKPVEAIDVAKKGDVIVIYNASPYVAPWGELATHSCKNKGIAGVVIDGAVRDIEDIRAMKFPVFASAVVPNAGEPKGFGEINAEIKCGSQTVKPGDYIVGDDNGVVVIPKERAYEIARRAMEVKKNEDRVREEIKRGKTLSQVVELYKWEKK